MAPDEVPEEALRRAAAAINEALSGHEFDVAYDRIVEMVSLLEEVCGSPEDATYDRARAWSLYLERLVELSAPPGGDGWLDELVRVCRAVVSSSAASSSDWERLVRSYRRRARARHDAGDVVGSTENLQAAWQACGLVVASVDDERVWLVAMADVARALGELSPRDEQGMAAWDWFDREVDVRKRLLHLDPDDPSARAELLVAMKQRSASLGRGTDDRRRGMREVVEQARRFERVSLPAGRAALAEAMEELAAALSRENGHDAHSDDRDELSEAAVDIRRSEADRSGGFSLAELAEALHTRAVVLLSLDRPHEALGAVLEAVSLAESLLEHSESEAIRRRLALDLATATRIEFALGDLEAGHAMSRRAVDEFERCDPGNPR